MAQAATPANLLVVMVIKAVFLFAVGKKTGEPCVFPFLFQGQNYTDCTTDGRPDGKLWCATSYGYDQDLNWHFCERESCLFPFLFQGKKYTSCTTDGRGDGKLWCATTYNYDQDREWSFCDDSVYCVFPFRFEGTEYNSCTTDGREDGKLWCATTYDYDQNRKSILCEHVLPSGKRTSEMTVVMIAVIASTSGVLCVGMICVGVWMKFNRKEDRDDDIYYENNLPESIYQDLNFNNTQHEGVYEIIKK